jgi:type IV secretory pathway VirB9-like protein
MSRSFPLTSRAAMLLAASAMTLTAATAYAQTNPKSSQPPAPPAALSYGAAYGSAAAAKPAQAPAAAAAPAARPGVKIVDKPPVQAVAYKGDTDDAAAKLLRRHHHRRRHVAKPSAAQSAQAPQTVKAVLHDAEVKATEVPHAAEMINATLHYAYEPGKIYTVHTAPSYLTAIVLRPGEHLISKAAGDTVRWEVGETSQGASTVILIKPLDAGIHTDMILTTDQRIYVLDLVSGASGEEHSTLVDWHYPAEEMRELQISRAAATVAALAAQAQAQQLQPSPFITPAGATIVPAPTGPIPTGRVPGPPGEMRPIAAAAAAANAAEISPAALNFNYRVEPKGHAPGWTPEHVFDDGHKVFVKFPANVSTMEIPPLFVIGPKGEAELVNYRFENGYYVVDRLFSVGELRLGSKQQTVVKIVYRGGAR